MRKLSHLRENWDEVARWETRLLQAMTVAESAAELEALYREFRQELEETEHLYHEERQHHLADLQARLKKLDTFHREQH